MTERSEGLEVPFFEIADWADRFPWLFCGITHSGLPDEPFDLRRLGDGRSIRTTKRWRDLLRMSGFGSVIHARQVHGTKVLIHDTPGIGVREADEAADGHVTSAVGLLVAITVADCVPVYIIAAQKRLVALLHAGWRGTAAGIFEALAQPYRPLPGLVDIRQILASQAQKVGVGAAQITISKDCTLCGESKFFSHRGGRSERQAAILGVRP